MAFPSDLLFYASYDSSLNADYSKNGYPVPSSTSGPPTIDTSSKQCGAGSLKLDGANYPVFIDFDYFSTPQAGLGQQGSVVCYRYTSSTLTTAEVLFLTVGSSLYSCIDIYNDPSAPNLGFDLYNGKAGPGNYLAGVQHSNPPVNTWYHLECNYDCDSGNIRMFINGVLVESDTFTPTSIGTDETSYDIGHRTRSVGIHRIDDLQVWNSVQHTANFTPACVSFGPTNKIFNNFASPFGSPLSRGFGR